MALFLPPSLVPSAIAPFVFKLQKESIHVVVLSTLSISAMVIVRSPPSPPLPPRNSSDGNAVARGQPFLPG